MAYSVDLPRFVRVTSAQYFAGSPKADTLYFLSDLGVIYDGTNLVTKGVQTNNSVKVPGLFYVLGTGADAKIVTYASADAEPTVIAISANEIDGKISAAISAAKEELNVTIDGLTAADIAFTAAEDGVVAGATVQAAIESIDAKLSAISGGEEGDSLASLGIRVTAVEELTEGYEGKGAIKTAVDAAQGAADDAQDGVDAINEKIGGEFSAQNTVAAAIEAAAKAGTDAAGAVDNKLANYTTTEDLNKMLGGAYSAESTVAAAIADAAKAGTDAAAAVEAKLADYSTTEQVDGKISAALASVLKFKGVVADTTALDAITGMVEGDVYYVTTESKEFVYVDEDGKKGWEELGATVDYAGMLAPYLLIGDTFTNGEILVANVDGEAKSAKTTGIKVGGAELADAPDAATLATEAAVAEIISRLAWKTTMD